MIIERNIFCTSSFMSGIPCGVYLYIYISIWKILYFIFCILCCIIYKCLRVSLVWLDRVISIACYLWVLEPAIMLYLVSEKTNIWVSDFDQNICPLILFLSLSLSLFEIQTINNSRYLTSWQIDHWRSHLGVV